MENKQEKVPLQTTIVNKPSLTPRELIMRHIENPDIPITDEDIQNLNLGHAGNREADMYVPEAAAQLSEKEKREADELADEMANTNTGTSYDVLGN